MKKRFLIYPLLTGASLFALTAPSTGGASCANNKEYENIKFEVFVTHQNIAREKYIYEMGQYNKAHPKSHKVIFGKHELKAMGSYFYNIHFNSPLIKYCMYIIHPSFLFVIDEFLGLFLVFS